MSLEKFRILLWKNWTVQKRHYKSGVFEVLFPVILIVIFSFIMFELGKDDDPSSLYIYENSFDNWSSCPVNIRRTEKIFYSPSSPWIDGFLNSEFNGEDEITIEAFENSQSLEDFLNNSPPQGVFGIEFDDSLLNATERPIVLNYTLLLPGQSSVNYCFARIQNQLEKGFLRTFGPLNIPEIVTSSISYSSSTADQISGILKVLFPVILIFSAFYTVSKVIRNVAIERESQLKESMKIMGLSSQLHWSAWFITSFAVLLLGFTLVTIFLKVKIFRGQAIFQNSNIFLIWIFFIVYLTCVITFCFLISVIFKKATTAANVGTVIFFATFVIFYQFRDKFYDSHYFVKLIYCLPLNTALGQGISMILDLEHSSIGLNFSNFAEHLEDYRFSILEVILMMIVAALIQLLAMVYIEQVFTGSIGVAKPWYFPLNPILKRFKNNDDSETKTTTEKRKQSVAGENFEEDPSTLKAGIKIDNISKSFGNTTVVNQLSLNIFEDQITVLLGHNGAGKTITISMLTGMLSPSSGTAFLNGHSIITETIDARNSLGFCPQHNILFDDLTMAEHITFFCRLKGVHSKKEIDEEIVKYAELLDFNDKINSLSKTLSGGQKRKLSIGVALCGNSKTVILDEPTSGLDAGARRSLWNLLIKEKKGRTILLTTHHLDEADILGDRIAIMNEGELQTVGSSFFLKKKFGSGYKLICVKETDCNPQRILDVLHEFASDSYLDSNTQTDVVFVINEGHLPIFPKMFKKIEDEMNSLKISTFGCSLTTLEEVFMKVGSQIDKTSPEKKSVEVKSDFIPTRKIRGIKHVFYQVYAIILKKFHYTRRNFYSIGWLTLLTAALCYVFLAAPIEFGSVYRYGDLGSNAMSLDAFNSTTTAIENDGSMQELADSYISLFGGKDKIEVLDGNFTDFIFQQFQISERKTYEKYMISVTIRKDRITAWYNSYIYSDQLQIISLNMVHRALLKVLGSPENDILAFYKRFNYTQTEETGNVTESSAKAESDDDDNEIQLTPEEALSYEATLINFALIFMLFYIMLIYWPSIFIAIKVKERVTRSKLLQFISGTNRFVYWLTSFFIDFTVFLSVIYIIVGVVAANQRAYFRTGEQIGTLLALFSFYGFSMLPLVYAMSFLFEKHAKAESLVPVLGLALTVVFMLYILLKTFFEWNLVADILYWIFLFFAPFSVIDCFRKIINGSTDGKKHEPFTFTEFGLGDNIVMLMVSGVLYLSFCFLKDHLVFEQFIHRFKNKFRKLSPKPSSSIDEDVKDEVEKINKMSQQQLRNENMALNRLSKFYGNKLAVNQLCLRVERAECFGLLGVNGAGKTSTFKMMTGDEIISEGDVWIGGNSMKDKMIKAQRTIGYCPQFDALLFDISGRESLKIFSLMRGIPIEEIDSTVDRLAVELGFHMHLDKKIKAYSGGNKRKLSAALSLLGDSNLIFLDEPTTGIDPYSKRQLWNMINKTRNNGKSVILTSHSMEECEALCTRIAIMVDGEFKCLGSAQHLKNKFAKGFVLMIEMKQDSDDQYRHELQNQIQRTFPLAVLKDKHINLLTFHITSNDLTWSEIFRKIAEVRDEVEINDFTVTQMSLEQVFLYFTRDGQNEMSQSFTESSLI